MTTTTTSQNNKDWHPEDIKAEIRKAGFTMVQLSKKHNYNKSAVQTTLKKTLA